MPTSGPLMRLRVSSPAATSSTIVTAIWVTTSPSRSAHRRPPGEWRDVALQLGRKIRARRLQRRHEPGHQGREQRDAA